MKKSLINISLSSLLGASAMVLTAGVFAATTVSCGDDKKDDKDKIKATKIGGMIVALKANWTDVKDEDKKKITSDKSTSKDKIDKKKKEEIKKAFGKLSADKQKIKKDEDKD